LAPVGMHGEIIMDYSIHDAIEAGFNKVIFIIRKDIEEAFREAIGDRIEKICAAQGVEVAYTYQEREDLPADVVCPADRTKPWGTGQAVLACREILHEPFAVINADDYYGKEAFVKIHDFLENYTPEQADALCMAGFILKNTLSDNGSVARGICETNAEGYLTPEFMKCLEDGFVEFFEKTPADKLLKAEYLLPIYIDELLQNGKVSVKVLDSHDKWFGVTYKEDKSLSWRHLKS
jgi:hypothetical protein